MHVYIDNFVTVQLCVWLARGSGERASNMQALLRADYPTYHDLFIRY